MIVEAVDEHANVYRVTFPGTTFNVTYKADTRGLALTTAGADYIFEQYSEPGPSPIRLIVHAIETLRAEAAEAKIEAWHRAETTLTVHEWLGWTESQYARFVETRVVEVVPR